MTDVWFLGGEWYGSPACVYDRRPVAEDRDGLNQRMKTCYDYADRYGLRSPTEFVELDVVKPGARPTELVDAVTACIVQRAVLLAYAPEYVSTDSTVLRWIVQKLGDLPLVTMAAGLMIVNRSGDVVNVSHAG